MSYLGSLHPPKTDSDLKYIVSSPQWRGTRNLNCLLEYALRNQYEMAFHSAPRVAKTCNVSNTTVHRLASSLGLESYTQLREIFRNELRK